MDSRNYFCMDDHANGFFSIFPRAKNRMQKNIRKKIKKNLNGNGIKNNAAPITAPVNMAFKTCVVFINFNFKMIDLLRKTNRRINYFKGIYFFRS
jgi:hypothetical protein